MLDGLNAWIEAFGLIFAAVFNAPLYGELTYGWFIVGSAVIGIMITFFISKMK